MRLPVYIEPEYTRASHCDGDCPPWWAPLAVHVKAGECTPMPVMMLHRWHRLHAHDCEAPIDAAGLLQ